MVAPAAAIHGLRKIQLVKEVTHGLAVTTATARLIGKMDCLPDLKIWSPVDYETGKQSEHEYSTVVGKKVDLPFEGPATYQQLGYLLAMAIKGGVTPTGPTDSLYTWTFAPNLTSANNPDSYTIQVGDDIQEYYAAFCFARDLELSGSNIDEGDIVKVKANIIGQDPLTGTFTSLTNPTALWPIIVSTGKAYIDTAWANLGNSQAEATVLDFSYKLSPGIQPVKYLDGYLYYTQIAEKKRSITLTLSVAVNTNVTHTSTGLWANFANQTKTYIRLKFLGPLVGATSYAELDLDGAYKVHKWGKREERDGQVILTGMELVSEYDATGTAEWQVILKNALATLP